MDKDDLKARVLLKEWSELRAEIRLYILIGGIIVIAFVATFSFFIILTLITERLIFLVVAPAIILVLAAVMGLLFSYSFNLGIRLVEIEEMMDKLIGKGFLKWELIGGLFPPIGEDVMVTQLQRQMFRLSLVSVSIAGGMIVIATWFGVMWLLSVNVLYGLLVTTSYITGYALVLYYALSIAFKRWVRTKGLERNGEI